MEHEDSDMEEPGLNGVKHEEEDADAKNEPEMDATDTKVDVASPASSRKRPGSAAAIEGDSSDDEPPIKKQRLKREAEEAKQSKKGRAKATSSAPVSSTDSRKQWEVKLPKAQLDKVKATAEPRASTKGKKEKKEEPEALVRSRKSASPAMKAVKLEDEANEDAEEVSESAQSEAEESEEEKPEIAAKAREKVQSTLTGKSKDPYPDWEPGEPVPYAALCTTFSLIEMTTKRLEIQSHCSKFLQQVMRLTPNDLLPTVMLMVNKLAADYAGVELGIGESLIMKAIVETTGRNEKIIKADQKEIGDLGLVAAKSRSNQPTMFKPKPLTVRGVKEGLMSIAIVEGSGSQARKIGNIKKLLSAADAHLAGKGSKGIDITKDKGGPSECKFIIRALEGKMRLGLAEKSIIISLAHAMVMYETAQRGKKLPSTDDLAEGEKILKAVYK